MNIVQLIINKFEEPIEAFGIAKKSPKYLKIDIQPHVLTLTLNFVTTQDCIAVEAHVTYFAVIVGAAFHCDIQFQAPSLGSIGSDVRIVDMRGLE